jgi:hypothetical protein
MDRMDENPADRSVWAAVGLAAFVALSFGAAVVWMATRWSLLVSTTPAVPIDPGPLIVVEAPPPASSAPAGPQIAVTRNVAYDQYDDIRPLLQEMGEGYAFDEIRLDRLGRPGSLDRYKVVFLGCAAEMAPAAPTIPPMQKFMAISLLSDTGYLERVKKALVGFVRRGGALYASDWACSYLELAFPDHIRFAPERLPRQHLRARVLDAGLADLIGPGLELTFDIDLWVCAESTVGGRTYLDGDVRHAGGSTARAPLLVSFRIGEGTVVFTSFHNEKQVSEDERRLLHYLVLKPIVAGAAQSASAILSSQAFTLEKESLFSTGGGTPRSFPFRAVAGQRLTFVLSWNVPPAGAPAAALELVVTTPSGRELSARGDAPPVSIPVASSEAGEYRYAVRPLTVPYGNFPYVVSIGTRR